MGSTLKFFPLGVDPTQKGGKNSRVASSLRIPFVFVLFFYKRYSAVAEAQNNVPLSKNAMALGYFIGLIICRS